ncbi:MAG: acetyl-CoA carboxylase biotin carboxylase subunit, partial [Pseudomonadota bacterium]|nr:acetyl-CoA carboxylase biotin carboxylase subunit [Pseudomonadota bacterium]
VEIQFMGDGKSYVHCFERECSVQRRRQKVWEEAPAIGISDDIRNRICEAALSIAQKAGYVGIGTVEFLYDTRTTEFYFIEVNTRIQVEHPVTEMITGIDLVRVMIEIASTGELPLTQKKIQKTGHAIECRINAEDPFNDFFPSPGCVDRFLPPEGAGVRFDSMLFEGYTVPPYYDSLLGKLIVSSSSRAAALEKMDRALDDIIIEGIRTTIPLHKRLVSEKQIQAGNFDINFLENMLVSDQEQRKNNND